MTVEVDLNQLNLLHPNIRPYVRVLLKHEFGLLKDSPKIHGIQCGSIIKKNNLNYGDRFHLTISYCKKPLNWQVLMNGDDVTKAPDFIMEENFLAAETAHTIAESIPSLCNWNPRDVNCLLNVILEILALYKNYQVNSLRSNPRFQRYFFEYDALLLMTDKLFDDVEICVQNTNRLPVALPRSKHPMLLAADFKENAKNSIQLLPRKELEDMLESSVEVPDLPSNMLLVDYVSEIENILQSKVEKVINFTQHRKLLFSYLLQYFEPALLNGDYVNFKNVSFLLEVNQFCCILHVHIPENYPENQTLVQVLPFQKMNNSKGGDYNFTCEENTPPEEVAKKIVAHVKEMAVAEQRKNISSVLD